MSTFIVVWGFQYIWRWHQLNSWPYPWNSHSSPIPMRLEQCVGFVVLTSNTKFPVSLPVSVTRLWLRARTDSLLLNCMKQWNWAPRGPSAWGIFSNFFQKIPNILGATWNFFEKSAAWTSIAIQEKSSYFIDFNIKKQIQLVSHGKYFRQFESELLTLITLIVYIVVHLASSNSIIYQVR